MRGQLGLEDAEVPWPPAGSPPAPPRVQETRHTGLGAAGQGGGGAAASHGPSPPTACPPSPDDGRDMKSHERATSPCSGREPGRQAHVGPLRNSPEAGAVGSTCSTSGAAVLWLRHWTSQEQEGPGGGGGTSRLELSTPPPRAPRPLLRDLLLPDLSSPCHLASAS